MRSPPPHHATTLPIVIHHIYPPATRPAPRHRRANDACPPESRRCYIQPIPPASPIRMVLIKMCHVVRLLEQATSLWRVGTEVPCPDRGAPAIRHEPRDRALPTATPHCSPLRRTAPRYAEQLPATPNSSPHERSNRALPTATPRDYPANGYSPHISPRRPLFPAYLTNSLSLFLPAFCSSTITKAKQKPSFCPTRTGRGRDLGLLVNPPTQAVVAS